MPIENHPSNGDVSSPGLDSQHLDNACGASGAGHHRNAGLGLYQPSKVLTLFCRATAIVILLPDRIDSGDRRWAERSGYGRISERMSCGALQQRPKTARKPVGCWRWRRFMMG